MRIKNKLLKLVLMFIVMLLILCISNNVKAKDEFTVEHDKPMEPIDCKEQGNPYFFCRNEFTPWNFYEDDESRIDILMTKFYYENAGEITLAPTISFGLHTLQAMGGSLDDLAIVQHLIWGSVKYGETTCEGGDASLYDTDGSVPIQRADQFGKFYYGVLGGGKSDLELKIKEGADDAPEAKVYINQKEKTAIIGPYTLILPELPADIEANLWNELAGLNTGDDETIPRFAKYEIELEGGDVYDKKKPFLDENGAPIEFPRFNEKFYLKIKLDLDALEVKPTIKINYVKDAKGLAYGYTSEENKSQVPTYAVVDMWYAEPDGLEALRNSGSGIDGGNNAAGQHLLDFVKNHVSVRRNWNWKQC